MIKEILVILLAIVFILISCKEKKIEPILNIDPNFQLLDHEIADDDYPLELNAISQLDSSNIESFDFSDLSKYKNIIKAFLASDSPDLYNLIYTDELTSISNQDWKTNLYFNNDPHEYFPNVNLLQFIIMEKGLNSIPKSIPITFHEVITSGYVNASPNKIIELTSSFPPTQEELLSFLLSSARSNNREVVDILLNSLKYFSAKQLSVFLFYSTKNRWYDIIEDSILLNSTLDQQIQKNSMIQFWGLAARWGRNEVFDRSFWQNVNFSNFSGNKTQMDSYSYLETIYRSGWNALRSASIRDNELFISNLIKKNISLNIRYGYFKYDGSQYIDEKQTPGNSSNRTTLLDWIMYQRSSSEPLSKNLIYLLYSNGYYKTDSEITRYGLAKYFDWKIK